LFQAIDGRTKEDQLAQVASWIWKKLGKEKERAFVAEHLCCIRSRFILVCDERFSFSLIAQRVTVAKEYHENDNRSPRE
jgi:hypothetical protein